ncbi:hypothetical protein BS50DRAFT_185593 [Corynespora cassiicola Philippines]|uniref:Uncharacterized protein n=1 Tax=Corynespora cassiicola Philippines TaxID=1448308 RepID=A0A2T2P6Q7_CORCC|nr:hypothetical protein BS50DRAFT_185593 [Corynespora cassiicola Philippines]
MSSVSKTPLIVSTSSASFVRHAIKPRRAPEATDAGYSLAKLRRPRMAARRSSNKVALARRLLRVLMVSVAVCLAGAWASSMRNMVTVVEASRYHLCIARWHTTAGRRRVQWKPRSTRACTRGGGRREALGTR